MKQPKEIHSIWDKEYCVDRYTVCFKEKYFPGKQYLALNDYPANPSMGFSQWGELKNPPGPYLGKRIKWADLPEHVQKHIICRMAEGN